MGNSNGECGECNAEPQLFKSGSAGPSVATADPLGNVPAGDIAAGAAGNPYDGAFDAIGDPADPSVAVVDEQDKWPVVGLNVLGKLAGA